MTTATPTQFYATETEADAYLTLKSDWLSLSSDVKEDALLWGRYYLDVNFDCVIDMDAIDDEVKYANSLLAYDYTVQGDLFFDNQQVIKSKKVVAGKVATSKEYATTGRDGPASLSKVVAILKPVCSRIKGKLKRV